MKLELKFLIIAIIAIVLAVPVAFASQHRTQQIKIEKSQKNNLQIKLDSKQKELEEQQKQLELQEKKNRDLEKKLQAKREAEAQIAQAHSAPVAHSGNCSAYKGLVAKYNWNVNTAMAIMQAESGCNTAAISPTCDHGLMQINCVHRDMVGGDLNKLHDPATNIRVAYAIYSGGGWSPWTTYTSGAYLKYL